MYVAIVWWPRVGLATVRAELGHLQRLACVSITGSVRTAPAATLEVLLGLPAPLYLVAEAEVRASAYRLRGTGLRSGRGSDGSCPDPCLTNSPQGSVFQMHQDKMISVIALGAPFKVEIPSCEHWLSIWPVILQFKGLVWCTDRCRMAGRCMRAETRKEVIFSFGVHATVFQLEIFVILACEKECIGRDYRGEHIYICSDSQAALRARCIEGNVEACLGISTGIACAV
jgi:hypothetical protein